jgi:hypothetical protein
VERAKNRPFHCNICGKGFATESSLRTHTSKVGTVSSLHFQILYKRWRSAWGLLLNSPRYYLNQPLPKVERDASNTKLSIVDRTMIGKIKIVFVFLLLASGLIYRPFPGSQCRGILFRSTQNHISENSFFDSR